MKLKYDIYFQALGDEWIGVPVGDSATDSEEMLRLNGVGHDIVELMVKETTREDVVECILDQYDTQRPEVEHYVDEVIDYLTLHGLLI